MQGKLVLPLGSGLVSVDQLFLHHIRIIDYQIYLKYQTIKIPLKGAIIITLVGLELLTFGRS